MWQYLSVSIARHIYNAPSTNFLGFAKGIAMGGITAAVFSTLSMLTSVLQRSR